MVKDQYCVTNDHSSYNTRFSSFDWKRKKKLPWQNGYKGLFSAARDPNPHPHSFRQRGYTWINCAEQRLNYVGWRITQGSFCCPARTHSHPTLSCQQVFPSNSHSSKKRLIPLTGTGVAKFFFTFEGRNWNLMVDHRPEQTPFVFFC